MAKLTVRESATPTQEVLRAANANLVVTDSRGRKIEVRKLKTLDRMRLLELVGSENANNDRYLGYATLAFSVTSIDDQPIPRPATKMALEAIVQNLDDDGFEAVSKGIAETFLPKVETEAQLKEAIKNG